MTVALALSGLPASKRDGRLRAAISAVIGLARQRGCHAIVMEDLDFADAREQGRERHHARPSRGRRGRSYRALVSGLPTGRFRDRLIQLAANAGLAVIAADPASPPAGEPSTGSVRCGNEFRLSPPAATTRPPW